MPENNDHLIKVTSSGKDFARVSPLVLRQKGDFRLIFKPSIVSHNPKNPEACIRGELWYQRKGRSEEWKDYKTFDHFKLRKGEATKLELDSETTLRLSQYLNKLYRLSEEYGSGDGEYEIKPAPIARLWDSIVEQVIQLADKGIQLKDLLQLEIDPQKLAVLNSLVDITNIKIILDNWKANKDNPHEEYWQNFFAENPWILSQIFACPVVLVEDKAYVGGKGIDNKRGKITDYLMKNKLTQNVAIIEIKAPTTELIKHSENRPGVHPVSDHLSGGGDSGTITKTGFAYELANTTSNSEQKV